MKEIERMVTDERRHYSLKVHKNKINAGNSMKVINMYAVAAVRYMAGIIK